MMHTRLSTDFYSRHTVTVAKALLGKELVFGPYHGIITETEAYHGEEDPACHAARGCTPRTRVMYGPAGFSYVYIIYGMYYCLNIVTETEGFPAAVLIRGLYLIEPVSLHLNGPGKLCRELKMTTAHNAMDMTTAPDFYVTDAPDVPESAYNTTPRIGISKGLDLAWRFVLKHPQEHVNHSLMKMR